MTLSPTDQQQRIEQLQQVTGIDNAEQCKTVLVAHDWNIEVQLERKL